MREIATAAERLGYGYITVSDHIVVPRKIDPNYPTAKTENSVGRPMARSTAWSNSHSLHGLPL